MIEQQTEIVPFVFKELDKCCDDMAEECDRAKRIADALIGEAQPYAVVEMPYTITSKPTDNATVSTYVETTSYSMSTSKSQPGILHRLVSKVAEIQTAIGHISRELTRIEDAGIK